MPRYGPWHEPVTQTITVGQGGFEPSGVYANTYYNESVGNQFQAQAGFDVTQHTVDPPTAGYSYDGSTVALDQADPITRFDPVALNAFLMLATPTGASAEVDIDTVVLSSDAHVYVHPLAFSGGDTATVFEAGAASGAWASPGGFTPYATFDYGDTTVVQIDDQAMTPSGGVYNVHTVVWDTTQTGDRALSAPGTGRVTVRLSLEISVQSPRYRFVYPTAPRLRQFPRDDTLGGAPRQVRHSRSMQGSARQGWTGTYR